MSNLLTWKEGQYTSHYGCAGGVRLFVISWKSRREDPNWLMRCDLPGLSGQGWKDDDRAVLQAKAEELLAAWLKRIGAAS